LKQGFSSAFIDRLNRTYNAGVWLKAAVVSYEGGTDYWVHYGESITFKGNVYQPLPMQWEGIDASATMSLPGIRVSVSNIQGIAEAYVDTVDLLGKDVRLQILHLDLLGTPKDVDEVAVQVQSIEITTSAVSILCGLNMGLNDSLPRNVIQKSEFPGNSDDIRRYTII
jgi:hypothetical protein